MLKVPVSDWKFLEQSVNQFDAPDWLKNNRVKIHTRRVKFHSHAASEISLAASFNSREEERQIENITILQ